MVVRSLLCVGLLVPSVAFSAVYYDEARVIDAQPLYETVTVNTPREVCRQERYAITEPTRPRSAAIPVLAAVIGGALGNAVGHSNTNKKVGTAVGAVLGGAVGLDIANRRQVVGGVTRYETRSVCSLEDNISTEENLVGYRVRYRYQGQVYVMRTDRHPGDTVRVRVDVTPA
jgi:uncharacterized protein YcfJ